MWIAQTNSAWLYKLSASALEEMNKAMDEQEDREKKREILEKKAKAEMARVFGSSGYVSIGSRYPQIIFSTYKPGDKAIGDKLKKASKEVMGKLGVKYSLKYDIHTKDTGAWEITYEYSV